MDRGFMARPHRRRSPARFAFLLALPALAGLLASCSYFIATTDEEDVKKMDAAMARQAPGKRETVYDESLKQFGRMLEAYNITPIKIQSKVISNETASKTLPDDVSKMLATALNKVGKEVVYIPYDPNYIRNELSLGGTINRALPDIVIQGGITEHDKDMIQKNKGGEMEAMFGMADGGANYDTDSAISRIALDLHMLNYSTQSLFPGVQATNTMLITKDKRGWGVAAYYMGNGLSFNSSIQNKQGEYSSIRLLVELSVLEILGKYFDVPYWRCLTNAAPDKDMVERIKEEFKDLPESRQNAYIKEYLFLHGHRIDRNGDGEDATRMAMSQYQCGSKTDLFMKLWLSVPIEDARDRVRTERKRAEEESAAAQQLAQLQAAQRQRELKEQQAAAAAQTQTQPQAQPESQPQPQPEAAQLQPQPTETPAPPPEPPKKPKNAPTGVGQIKDSDW